MKNFLRALRMAFRYKWSLITSVFCALMVALLWGANIGAVYPFVQAVLEGQSLHEWVEVEIDKSQTQIKSIDAEIDQNTDRLGLVEGVQARKINSRIARLKIQKQAEEGNIAKCQWLEPYIKKYTPNDAYQTLVYIIVLIVVCTLVKSFFLAMNMILVARVGKRTVLDLQKMFFRKTMQMDLGSFGKQGTGDLSGRIRGETESIGVGITTVFGKTLREPFKMAACLVGAALINWRLLIFSMLICPITGYILFRLTSSIKRANKKAFQESAKLMNRLFQALTYVKIVKAHNMEGHERSKFQKIANDVYQKSMKIAVYNSLFRVNNEILGISIICLSVLAGGYLVLNEELYLFGIKMADRPMDFGRVMLFFAFLIGISDPIRKLADVYNMIQSGIVASDRVFAMIDVKPEIKSPESAEAIPEGVASLSFQNVSFAYEPDQPILHNISFDIQAGEKLAIVGANGSGKSTLVNLLPRFYDPNFGKILLDGHDLRDYKLRDVRRYLGLVTQQTMLFQDTVLNNIRYGAPRASEADCISAAKKAHAHQFIMNSLEKGYDTKVGEHGSKLSGGQRQRIALARAILRDSKLLILDEATSQIDPESEVLIHRALEKFIENRSAIMITHRFSTLDLADRILILEQGSIVDIGSHEELMDRCEIYQRLRSTSLRESA